MGKVLIGYYIIEGKDEMQQNRFECAAWFETVEVPAGKYPIFGEYEYSEKEKCFTNEIEDNSIYCMLDGIILDDNFQSLYAGLPIGEKYDIFQNRGKETQVTLRPYAHKIASDLVEDGFYENKVELLPEFEAKAIYFEFDGMQQKTYGIVRKETK